MKTAGVQIETHGLRFSVVSRNATKLWVSLFEDDNKECERFALERVSNNRFEGFRIGGRAGQRYGLRADGPSDEGQGHCFDPSKILLDPFATRIDRAFRYDERLAIRGFDTAELTPKAIVESPLPEANRLAGGLPGLIYEICVPSFTRLHPEIPLDERGKIKALAHSAIIDQLTRLGVGTVELMPITASIDERHLPPLGLSNAWGYNPVSFFAPDPRIAPGGIADIRDAVAALHAAGIRVVLDLVYNHTGESDALGPSLSLKGLDQALYFRHSHGRLVNDTGCGNTLALDRPDVIELVMESLRHWVRATGIDGFRFDLATVLARRETGFDPQAPLFQEIADDPILQDRLLIAEPWDVGPGGYQLGRFPAPFLEWNDRYRDDVRQFWRGDRARVGNLATRLAGSSDVFSGSRRPPSASVNFIAAHDGLTLADCVAYAAKHNEANGEDNRDGTNENFSWNCGVEGVSEDQNILAVRRRDIRALMATLFLSRGSAMLTAGDEFGRTQRGNNNAYAQDNEITILDWEERDKELESFVSQLSHARAKHPVLADNRWLTGLGDPPDVVWLSESAQMTATDWEDPERNFLAMELTKTLSDGTYDHVLAVFNRGAETSLRLPEPMNASEWTIEWSTVAGAKPIDGVTAVPARSVMLLSDNPPPAEGSAKLGGITDQQLRRLAIAHRVAPEWWDLSGLHHEVPVESLRVILGSMGIAARTGGDLAQAWENHNAKGRRTLGETIVVSAEHPQLSLNLPRRQRPSWVTLNFSINGETRELAVRISDLACVRQIEVGGDTFETFNLPISDLPVGVHRGATGEETCTLLVAPGRCYQPDEPEGLDRYFGLTSHLYGLRHHGDEGIGDLETLARFGVSAGRLGAKLAGVNPLHHLFPYDRERSSPYQPSDRRFVDPIYINLDEAFATLGNDAVKALYARFADEIRSISEAPHVEYVRVWAMKDQLLRALFEASAQAAGYLAAFERFIVAGGINLAEHALFQAICTVHKSLNRGNWAPGLAAREPASMEKFRGRHGDEIRYNMFLQWIAEIQLASAQKRMRRAGCTIGIYRDLAVGTAMDGGEIWSDHGSFAHGVSIGAPPDPFAADGQVWCLPPPNPISWLKRGLSQWSEIVAANMRHAGALRIDHILGFARLFFVPEGASGACGAYVGMPRDALIATTAIESHRAKCLVIGEDLGTAEAGLSEALNSAGIYSTRVLWFEREGVSFTSPVVHKAATAACLSTHDLPTLAGWRQARDIMIDAGLNRIDGQEAASRVARRQDERLALSQACGGSDDAVAVHRFMGTSGAALVLAQVEDLTGEVEPMNVPGTDREWPNWRRRLSVTVEELPDSPAARSIVDGLQIGRSQR